jgi:threonyl-tRNA synthetase
MPLITLPDNSQKKFAEPVTVQQIAESIGAGLAKAALAGKVDGKLVDTSFIIKNDAKVSIVTEKDSEGLEIIRHSTAHLLAHAVKSLFPAAQVTIGPVIENGFYYDFAYERPFTPEDLTAIETKMQTLAQQNLPVVRTEMSRAEAIEFFQNQGEAYKVEIIKDIPGQETLSFYQQGDFVDLCRGPHTPNTGKLKIFKLMHVAGAYWRGDSNNAMLQRIYGTAWLTKKDLEDYLHRLEEAEKRDHRKTAKILDLFHIQEESPGMVFWHANGWIIYQIMEQYLRQKLQEYDYQEIKTPQIASRSLWERSGHWDKFGKEMFITQSENRDYAIKPMSCPCHVQVFNQGLRSYRELPLRLAEFGSCHRNEPSGALHGLLRVRHFVQDDGHIFCTEEQLQSELATLIELIYMVYRDFGFNDILVKLATRPEERVGSDAAWDKAEKVLAEALDYHQVTWELNPGEGAFYGPKIEFSLRDCLGRVWQCGTIQVDFAMPERLDAKYIAEDGSRQHPVMIHRAIIGTFERFMGILLEQYAGLLPTWLAPVQAVVMNITDQQITYSTDVAAELKNQGLRIKSDLRNEKIGFKIREHTIARVPYLLVVGDKEVAARTIAVRKRTGEDLGNMTVAEFSKLWQADVAKLGQT